MKALLALFISVSYLVGCAHGGAVFPNEDGWVVENKTFLFLSWSDFYYCQAKKAPDGKYVNPTCYEADVKSRTTITPVSGLRP